MKILYIFPHPDDESFGPAAAIHSQLSQGHEVHLLTLTRGGATRQRHKLGLSVSEMGEVRYKEMLDVEKTLGLNSMTVLDYPDSGLQEMDPRELENTIKDFIKKMTPDVIVTYPVHGISGFHDHLVTHAVVKRVYLELKDEGASYLKRLAFVTVPDDGSPSWSGKGLPRLKLSGEELIDCIINLNDDDVNALKDALACYATYKETIEESGVVETIGDKLYFEFFQEDCKPVVDSITQFE
ncbi:MAG: PIG-L family deacetylase [Fibrobacteria bacterium]|nr:PIG-L family deacetylase [Fibrobacteria bacterium]